MSVVSSQNRLKNKFRASIGADKLELLLKITMLGPDSNENIYENVIDTAIVNWLSSKKRRKGRLFEEYRPRPKKQKLC